MRIDFVDGGVRIDGIAFDAQHTLKCGQTFAWQPQPDGSYVAVVDGKAVRLFQLVDGLTLTPCDVGVLSFWLDYFDLVRDYDAALRKYEGYALLSSCFAPFRGLRVLNQPVWETLCAFILSANNNEGRITKCVNALCEQLGARVEAGGVCGYAFPTPAALHAAGEARLRELGMGYRAKYLIGTAQMVLEGFDLGALMDMPYEQALSGLMRFPGVGEKVADCVLLFSLKKAQAFPVDVWMERALRQCFGMSGTRHSMKAQALALFGDEAGIVQQYIFHSARKGLLDEYFLGETSS